MEGWPAVDWTAHACAVSAVLMQRESADSRTHASAGWTGYVSGIAGNAHLCSCMRSVGGVATARERVVPQ